MAKLLKAPGRGLRPVYLRDTYPYSPNSDLYIGLKIVEIPEPFVTDVMSYAEELGRTKPVGYVADRTEEE